MLFFTLGLNFVVPQMAQAPAFGMGGGGAPEILSQAPAEAGPAFATEAPVEEPPAAAEMVPLPTQTVSPATDSTVREAETPADKQGVTNSAEVPAEARAQSPITPPVPPSWQIVLGAIALLGAIGMVLMRQAAASHWRRK